MLNSVRYAGIARRRVDGGLRPSGETADDHRGVRTAQDERGDVDDVRDRHVRAAGDRKLHLEGGGQRREEREKDQGRERREVGARDEQREGQPAQHDDPDDVPTCASRQFPQLQCASSIVDRWDYDDRPPLGRRQEYLSRQAP